MDAAVLQNVIGGSRTFDLGVEFHNGMPHHPMHPPFVYAMPRLHGDVMYGEGTCTANDLVVTGTHVGTHLDGLGHVSRYLKLHAGLDALAMQDKTEGLRAYGMETVQPILRRGILLDVAGAAGKAHLGPGDTIGGRELEAAADRARVQIRTGDAVLIRTGWIHHWPTPTYLNAAEGNPGVTLEGARWLSAQGIFLAGADTVALEKVPNPPLPVHCHLLFERGIHILEIANLEEIARAGISEFLFVCLPLKIRGATGCPVRPIAVA